MIKPGEGAKSGSGLEVRDVGIEYYVERHQAYFRAVDEAGTCSSDPSAGADVPPASCDASAMPPTSFDELNPLYRQQRRPT